MRTAVALVMVALLSNVAHADGAVVVLVDRAMSSDKIATITHALTESLDSFARDDQIAIVSYAKTARIELPLQSVSRRTNVSRAVSKIQAAESSDLVAALRTAGRLLARSNRSKKLVLVVTDSEGPTGYQPAIQKLRKQGIQLSAMSYQTSNRSTLEALAREGGGRVHAIRRGQDLGRALALSAKTKPEGPDIAAVFLIDRSLSMQGPHLEAAKEIVRSMIEVVAPHDMIAVVAYDTEALVQVRPQRASNRMRISSEVSRLTAGGHTDHLPALQEAFEILEGVNADEKAVFLFSDDIAAPSDGVPDLLTKMRAANITVSVVALDAGSHRVLESIAKGGGGRLYTIDEARVLPRILVHEEEP